MAKRKSTVVGVFPEDAWAQQAIEALQSAGFTARLADSSTVDQLASMGIESNVVPVYRSRFAEGCAVVLVDDAGKRGEDALLLMMNNGAENMDLSNDTGASGASATASSGAAARYQQLETMPRDQRSYGQVDQAVGRARSEDEMRLQLREESLSATKQTVQAGEVQLRKTVQQEQQQIPVTLRHEEVVIERHPVDRVLQPGEAADMTEQVIEVPVYEERAELQKEVRVREEVEIGKRTAEEQRVLTGTVRREDVEVVPSGEVAVQGAGAASTQQWSEVMPTYRTQWQQRYGNSGQRWEDVEPAYSYAYQMSNDPRYRGRAYNEVESDLRSGWARTQSGAQTAWDKVSNNVKQAWNDLTS